MQCESIRGSSYHQRQLFRTAEKPDADFEGIRFDMTFWPVVCYCPHCTARYWKEQGAELLKVASFVEKAS